MKRIPVARIAGLPALLAVLLLAGATVPAVASTWCGHNGVIHLSFTPGRDWNPAAAAPAGRQAGLAPDSTAVARPAPGGANVLAAKLERPLVVRTAAGDSLVVAAQLGGGGPGAILDLYAVLEDVALVHWNEWQVRALGGVEFALKIEGGTASIVGQEFPVKAFNVESESGRVSAGYFPELPLRDGRATLVHWRLWVPAAARNLTFRLDPTNLRTCGTLEGCPQSGTQALWTGSAVSDLAGLIFSAGFTPAYLNWEGRPDLAVVRGAKDWQETGLFRQE